MAPVASFDRRTLLSVNPRAPPPRNTNGSCTADRSTPAAAKLDSLTLRLCQTPLGARCSTSLTSRPAACSQRTPQPIVSTNGAAGGASRRYSISSEPPCSAAERSEEHTSELQSLRHLVC